MSVRFEGGAVLEADYGPISTRLDDLPVSVQCWVYFHDGQAPASGEFWPLWTLGAGGGNYLALEAEEGTNASTVKLTAAFSGGTRESASVDNLDAGAWHLATVVLVAVGQTGDAELRLYVDGEPVQKKTGSKVALAPSAWDAFSLGRTLRQSGTPGTPVFDVEHPAIWSVALAEGTPSTSDAGRMFSGKIPPSQTAGRLPPTPNPDFGYWYITAHSRGGLRVDNRQDFPGSGDLFNEADSAVALQPLRVPMTSPPPHWSGNTPVLWYTSTQTITPSPRKPFPTPSRLQPIFIVVNDVNSSQDSPPEVVDPELIRQLPQYTDRNISRICYGDYKNSNGLRPPYLGVPVDYFPFRDLTTLAKRCADYFEMQSFFVGNGTGPGRRYAGAVQIRGPGLGGVLGGKLQGYDGGTFRPGTSFEQVGEDNGIPLEQNMADWVFSPNDTVKAPWSAWYRAEGVALLTTYMDRFWEALKQELDARGLCYPLRLHMDYEGWPDETDQLNYTNISVGGASVLAQVGSWPAIIGDDRADAATGEVLVFEYLNSGSEVARRLDDLSPESYDSAKDFYDQTPAFIDWWWGWSYATRAQAIAESIFKTAKDQFEFTQWGNYFCFVADNTDHPYVMKEGRAYNTPINAVIRGDFSTPVLFSNPAWVDRVRGWYDGRVGYTVCESVRDVAKMRIDACANSRRKLALAPTFENALHDFEYGDPNKPEELRPYQISVEDQRDVFEHAWRQGADEYLLFSFNPTLKSMEAYTGVAQWLRDSIHATAQYHQDHAGRTARLSRRAM